LLSVTKAKKRKGENIMVKIIETKEAFLEVIEGKLYTTEPRDKYMMVAVYSKEEKKTLFYKAEKDIFSKTADLDVEVWNQGELVTSVSGVHPYFSERVYVNKVFLWDNEDCFKIRFSVLRRQLNRVSPGKQRRAKFLSANFEEPKKKVYRDPEEDYMFDFDEAPFEYSEKVLVQEGELSYMARRVDIGWKEEEVYVANIQEDYDFRYYKDSGKAYLYKGKKVVFANYAGNNRSFPIRLNGLLPRVPDSFIKKMNAFILENHISPYEREAVRHQLDTANKQSLSALFRFESGGDPFLPYEEWEKFESLIYLSYYKGLQAFAGEEFISRDLGKLSRNRRLNEKIRDAETKKQVMEALLPQLTSKQVAKMKFSSGFGSGSGMMLLVSMMENKDQIEKVLKSKEYMLYPREIASIEPKNIKEKKKLIAETIGLARFEQLVVKGLNRSEATERNPFLQPDTFFVRDTLAYMKVVGNFTKEQKAELAKAKTFREMHDKLHGMVKERRDATYSKPIEYTNKERALEVDNGQFCLSLAHSKKELSDVGKAMGICVGSIYAEPAYNKKLGIAIVWEEDKPVFCIELDKKFQSVRQAKMRFNNRLNCEENKELADFFYGWMTDNGLLIDTLDISKDVLAKYKK